MATPFTNHTRNNQIYSLREKGRTLQEIATLFGLSRERVRQIYIKVKKEKEDAHVTR